jgi:hypothetical protein
MPEDLELLLADLDLDGLALVPATIDQELATSFLPVGRNAFGAPTFEDVVEAHVASGSRPGHRFRLAAKEILRCSQPRRRPACEAVILHTGRSGSTLLCNLLKGTCGWATLREPEFVNSLLLRLAATGDAAERDRLGELLDRLLRSLGHGVRIGPDGRERTSILKLSSWNAALADEFIGRLGDVPVIVIWRDPSDTTASFLHHVPYWYSSHSSGNPLQSVSNGNRTEAARFFAEMWNQIISAALRLPTDRTLFVEYADLVSRPDSVLSSILEHVGSGGAQVCFESLAPIMEQYSKAAGAEKFDAQNRHVRQALELELRQLVGNITAKTLSAVRVRMSQSTYTRAIP